MSCGEQEASSSSSSSPSDSDKGGSDGEWWSLMQSMVEGGQLER